MTRSMPEDTDWDDADYDDELLGADPQLMLHRLDPDLIRRPAPARRIPGRTAGLLRLFGNAAYALADRTGRNAHRDV